MLTVVRFPCLKEVSTSAGNKRILSLKLFINRPSYTYWLWSTLEMLHICPKSTLPYPEWQDGVLTWPEYAWMPSWVCWFLPQFIGKWPSGISHEAIRHRSWRIALKHWRLWEAVLASREAPKSSSVLFCFGPLAVAEDGWQTSLDSLVSRFCWRDVLADGCWMDLWFGVHLSCGGQHLGIQ